MDGCLSNINCKPQDQLAPWVAWLEPVNPVSLSVYQTDQVLRSLSIYRNCLASKYPLSVLWFSDCHYVLLVLIILFCSPSCLFFVQVYLVVQSLLYVRKYWKCLVALVIIVLFIVWQEILLEVRNIWQYSLVAMFIGPKHGFGGGGPLVLKFSDANRIQIYMCLWEWWIQIWLFWQHVAIFPNFECLIYSLFNNKNW